jgi:chromosome segregation ATPase
MGNEKYLNYYIEILTSTLNDCVIRNVSMQANAKITDDVIQEQTEKIEKLSVSLKEQEDSIKKLRENQIVNENNTINDLKNKLNEKDVELAKSSNVISELNNKYRDYDIVKSQSTHIDTFKNELIKAREDIVRERAEHEKQIVSLNIKNEEEKVDLKKQIAELSAKIDYLQLSPAKRKKIDELNKGVSTVEPIPEAMPVDDNAIKDGGTF